MKRLALATVAGLLSSTALVHAADVPVEAPIRAVKASCWGNEPRISTHDTMC